MLTVISIDEAEKWDNIVKSFKHYDVYYLSGYSKAFQIHGDGDPLLFYYEDSKIKVINVVMKRDIANSENFQGKLIEDSQFDLATPYGYGGVLVEGKADKESLIEFDKEYSQLCKCRGFICEFVRFHPILENHRTFENLYEISKLGKTISMDLESKDKIWCNLTSKNRNMVRKAQNAGVEIYWGRDAELYKKFISMYNDTMERDSAKEYYYFKEEFYTSILNDFKNHAVVFYAVYETIPIAMSIILFANYQMHYHLSTSNREYQHLAPTNLLLYEAACWGSENGYKTFHLGGGLGSSEDSLYKFKSSFNRNSDNTFEIGKKIFNNEKYEALVNILSANGAIEIDTKFFPQYRAELII